MDFISPVGKGNSNREQRKGGRVGKHNNDQVRLNRNRDLMTASVLPFASKMHDWVS